ncbi:MAG TPA: response regulator [Elusimicrobiota bacterium]|nr:response regulator [Elusimicrobiota bacterium]
MPDVLIFEDDPLIGALASDVARMKGLTAGHFLSGAGVLELVQEGRPRLVVLDIMMPGLDGLSACRALRANPATKQVKIVILTAKDSRQDRETALRYGADAFLNKPFDSAVFARTLGHVLGFPQDPAVPAPPSTPSHPVFVTVLRGGVAIQASSLWILLDAGEGLRGWLERQSSPPPVCWVLLSRYEPAAAAELAAAGLFLAAGRTVKLAGPEDPEGSLQRLAPRLCADAGGRRATPLLFPQREGEFSLEPGVAAWALHAQNPGPSMAYRVDIQGRKVVYCPAHEIRAQADGQGEHELEKFRSLFAGADVAICGFRRSASDPRPDEGRERASWEPFVSLARDAGVKRLILLPLGRAQADPSLEARVQALAGEEPAVRAALAVPGQSLVL